MKINLTAEGIGAYLLHVGQHVVQLERERDEARAEAARLRGLIESAALFCQVNGSPGYAGELRKAAEQPTPSQV